MSKFNNKTTFKRANHDSSHPFTVISNALIKDSRLTVTDKGIMVHILSHSDEFVINMTAIQEKSGIGRAAFQKSLKRLQNIGYLKKEKVRTRDGKQFSGWHWTINEYSLLPTSESLKSENQHSDIRKSVNRTSENRQSESHPIINTNASTTEGEKKKKEKTEEIKNHQRTTYTDDYNSEPEHVPDMVYDELDECDVYSVMSDALSGSTSALPSGATVSPKASNGGNETGASELQEDLNTYVFNSVELSQEIQSYTPTYFLFDTDDFLVEYYRKYKVEFQDNPINMVEFEKVLIAILNSQFQSLHPENNSLNLADILNWIKSEPTYLNIHDFNNYIQLLLKDEEYFQKTLDRLTPAQ